jgi:hypothetical protein
MGHCAPAVMQTLLDVLHTDAPWLVKACGGVTPCRRGAAGCLRRHPVTRHIPATLTDYSTARAGTTL